MPEQLVRIFRKGTIIRRVLESAEALSSQLEALGVTDEAESLECALANASNPSLLDLVESTAQLTRLVAAVQARTAGEIAYRSGRELAVPLARQYGHGSATPLLAVRGRMPLGSASALGKVGQAFRPRTSLLGERLPARFPLLAAALDAGSVPVESALKAIEVLERAERVMALEALAELEATLTECAAEYTVKEFAEMAAQANGHLDPDGVEPRERELIERAGITFFQRRDGLIGIKGGMDPLTAGFVKKAIDVFSSPRASVDLDDDTADGEGDDECEGGEGEGDAADRNDVDGRLAATSDAGDELSDPIVDTRSLPRKNLDALATACRLALGADDGQLGGIDTTVVVLLKEEGIIDDRVPAQIVGIDEPISAGTVRRLLSRAEIIPVVLGGPSEVLDLGRSQRLFSKPQRIAMVVQQRGGCGIEGCACDGLLEAAHVEGWWVNGTTDLLNGLLLCPFHHWWLDQGRWTIEVRDGRRVIIPSAASDPMRRPRPIRDRIIPF
ncbi:DUF222 domain-containing protein [Naasia lichenicola]|uniref:DUF222 domain-containing protein n=1 Tax=Naasia lichenicola TaxID=2565933 RepID=A0A4S4FSD8_9MICO|nr:DUF222 domain-containing protein [Naasia lichenicola]THG33314.1 DUF222 domain-containing protein [Naasia lichenicola]